MTVVVQLRRMSAEKLNEGGDEIYFNLNGVEQRPSGSPDYWLFERKGQRRALNWVVLDGAPGTRVTLDLREQDGGLRGGHDQLGRLELVAHADHVEFVELGDTTYRGQYDGYHVVDFHGSGTHYKLYFVARSVTELAGRLGPG